MSKPAVKPTMYTHGPKEELPQLDPINTEVAKPHKPENKKGTDAAEYAAPETPSYFDMAMDAVSDQVDDLMDMGTDELMDTGVGFLPAGAQDIIEMGEEGNYLGVATKSLGVNDFKSMKKFITSDDEGVGLDFESVRKRVESAFGISGGTGDLSGGIQDGVVRYLEDFSGISDIGVMVDGATMLLDPDNLKDAASITKLVEKISGASGVMNFLDIGAQAAMLNNIVDIAIDWGIPSFVDGIIDAWKDHKRQNAMYEELCIRAANKGSLESVAHFGKKMGGGRRRPIADQVIPLLIKRFKKQRGGDKSDAQYGNELIACFNSFKPNWERDSKSPSLTSLYLFSIASPAANKCLRFSAMRIHAQAGSHLRRVAADTCIRRAFPDLAY